MPWEYIEYILCSKVYHCTPSQLREEDADTIMLHLSFYNIRRELGYERDQPADKA